MSSSSDGLNWKPCGRKGLCSCILFEEKRVNSMVGWLIGWLMIDGGKFFGELLKTKNTEVEREAKIELEN